MTKEELLDLITEEEWTDIEFKKAENQLPTSVWQTVSAFANTAGGKIIFGVDEEGGRLIIRGVKNPEKLQSDFLTTLRGEKFNIALSAKAERLEIDGKKLLIFYIPEMPRQAKPIFYGGNLRNTYIRLGSGDQKCTLDEINRMLREASEQSSDSMILVDYSIDDLDLATITKYRNYLSSYDPTSALLGLTPEEFLRRIGAYSLDRSQNREGVTLAGLLLFGKTESITERMPSYENQYYYIDGTEWAGGQRWDDRLISQVNLIETFLLILERIKRHLDSPFFLKDTQRQENTPIMIAIRESLVNMLIHQDYFEKKIAQVRHLRNSITFINPGASGLRDIEDLYAGELTAPRNPKIAKAFRLIGWAELAGTGLLKIIQSWQEMNFALPVLDNDLRKYQFLITLSQQHFIAEEDKQWLSQYRELNDEEKLILVAAKKYGTISNSQIRLLLGISDTLTVSQMLSKLTDCPHPYLCRIGTKGPNVRYSLNEVQGESDELTEGIHLIDQLLLDEKFKDTLKACYEQPKSARDIMATIGIKDKEYFRRSYLHDLMNMKLLMMQYPDKPKHRSQKYFTNTEVIEAFLGEKVRTPEETPEERIRTPEETPEEKPGNM